ncbi:MAG: hypothetical protein WCX74_02910 [Candidatus Paceibacterota bacterium]
MKVNELMEYLSGLTIGIKKAIKVRKIQLNSRILRIYSRRIESSSFDTGCNSAFKKFILWRKEGCNASFFRDIIS